MLISLTVYIAFKISPWPSVMLIRYGFSAEGSMVNEELAKYAPAEIESKLDIEYDRTNYDATLDLHYQYNESKKRPLIVWVHGGGFVAGDKKELSNYCKILASKNFIVAAVNYTVAPEAEYPIPVNQLNHALAFLVKNAEEFKIDTDKIIVAGDSGGAHITAQLANVYTNSEYAAMLGIRPSIDPEKVKESYCIVAHIIQTLWILKARMVGSLKPCFGLILAPRIFPTTLSLFISLWQNLSQRSFRRHSYPLVMKTPFVSIRTIWLPDFHQKVYQLKAYSFLIAIRQDFHTSINLILTAKPGKRHLNEPLAFFQNVQIKLRNDSGSNLERYVYL